MLWSAKPRLKMTWCVPVTQIVPSGLRMRHTSLSHPTLKRRSLAKPIERIESLRLALRFRVLLGNGTDKLEVVIKK